MFKEALPACSRILLRSRGKSEGKRIDEGLIGEHNSIKALLCDLKREGGELGDARRREGP